MPRAKTATSLHKWYVISLRPKDGHAVLRRVAHRLGARVFAVSTMRIETMDAGRQLQAALRTDIVLTTSPSAARSASAQHLLKARRGQRWLAIGTGTATVLRRMGIADVHTPEHGFDSESLLAHPWLATPKGLRIGVLTAPAGRDLIATTLRARGAEIFRADVYRRVAMTPSPRRLRQLRALPETAALLVSSGEALTTLWQALADDDRHALLRRPCVVSSARLAAQVEALGWPSPIIAASALPADLLAALAAHVGRGRFR
ncbi:MAG TPA: uroporphyrinogen-III synthase [Arenimonas sp.]|uniref:uroporphyrinogen-III synthase n=1 Tax=Arenimonas sp. TaxID=1872635 RepID=UPI002C7F7F3F|nr:uroporphyrinogen-III synthase [Arenimonas sp.]HMB57138.1 uroporphyrinogen-III synthase [Arenimonas sp.]